MIGVVGLTFNILFVLLQKDVSVLPMGTIRWGDIILMCFQPLDNFFGCFIICRSAFRVKLDHDLVQAIDANLCIIDKF
jgi:hypothetical protein